MKSIKDFSDTTIAANELQFFCGGKEYLTTMMGESCPDTWYDNDDDGKFSPGDTICFDKCADQ